MNRKLYLFSGLGGDGRLFQEIRPAGLEVVTPPHLPPTFGDTLAEYASKIRGKESIAETDLVGGASFGGMIAAEIAKQQRVAGVVLLGSCIEPEKLPWSYRWIDRLGFLIPNFLLGLRSWRPLVRWRFAPIDRKAEELMIAMASDCPPSQLRAFGRMFSTWGGATDLPCPIFSIHGDNDKIIPLKCGSPDLVLKNAGHAFTLTHIEETNAAVQEFANAC